MDTSLLYALQPRSMTTLYSDLEPYALSAKEVFVGTAGTVIQRTNAAGFRLARHPRALEELRLDAR